MPNVEIKENFKKFKKDKLAELELLKQSAEGEDEKPLFRNRYGFRSKDGNPRSKEFAEGKRIDSADEFLQCMVDESSAMGLACLTGPPAFGKTVTMQQIVYAAAQKCLAQTNERVDIKSTQKLPLLPLFMRAAVLSEIMSNSNEKMTTLRQLVELFLNDGIAQKIFPDGAKASILKLYDMDQVLNCIDGLDEAAEHQELVEGSIKHAVKSAAATDRRVHMLLSTTEHSYVHSRACLRLGDLSEVNLQPLDEYRRQKIITKRLKKSSEQKGRHISGEAVCDCRQIFRASNESISYLPDD